MNIIVLDYNPQVAAEFHRDKHVVNMNYREYYRKEKVIFLNIQMLKYHIGYKD